MLPVDMFLLCGSSYVWSCSLRSNYACGDDYIATTQNELKLEKILEFEYFYKHFSFERNEEGYLEKRLGKTYSIEVFVQLG